MTDSDEPPVTLRDVAEGGNRRALLEAIRDRLASEIDQVVLGRDAAVISKELRAVLDEIYKLGGSEATPLDDLAARRAARRANATGS